MVRCLYTIVLLTSVCILVAKSSDEADHEDEVEDEDDGDEDYIQSARVNMSKVLIGKNKMKLKWDWPSPKPAHFIVQYNNDSVQVSENWVLLTNLLPFTNYVVEILACCPPTSIFGPKVYRTKTGIPGQVENFDLSQANATHVLLSWSAPLIPAGPNQFYKVRVIDRDNTIEMNSSVTNVFLPRPTCETDGSITSEKVTVRGVSVDPEAKAEHFGNVSTSVIMYVDCLWETNKELARVFKVDKLVISKTSIKLSWKAAKNDSFYLVTYNDQSVKTKSTSFALINLTPNTKYIIQISACHSDGNCIISTAPIAVHTKPGVPDKVENLGVTKVNATTFLVSWQPPTMKYGPELFYRVRIQSSVVAERTFDTDQSEALIQIPDCKVEESNANYTAIVTTINPNNGDELRGESVNATIYAACTRFDVLPPQLPYIELIDIGSTWIELKWSSPNADSYYNAVFDKSTVRLTDSQVILPNLTPNTNYAVSLYQCIKNCTLFFGPARLQTKALIQISVRNLGIVDVNSTHFRLNWQPPLAVAEGLSYIVILNELNTTINDTHVIIQKPICKSEDVILTAYVYLLHYNNSIYAPEPMSIRVPHPCLKLQFSFTKVVSSNSTIFLEWTPVYTGLESVYKVSYNGIELEVNETTIQLEYLNPNTTYDIQASICITQSCHILAEPLTVRTEPPQPIQEKPLMMELLNSSHALLSWSPAEDNEKCSYNVLIKFSNCSLCPASTDPSSDTVDLTSCDRSSRSTYVIHHMSNEKLCGQSNSQPPVMSVFEQSFRVKEVVNDWDLPVYVNKVVVLPTTIEMEWNGTDLGSYLIVYNELFARVSLPNIQLIGLIPNSSYSVEIFKCRGDSCNTSAVAPFIIHTPPQLLHVQNVTFITTSPQFLNITWQPPDGWQPSGVSWLYEVLVTVASIKSVESLEAKPYAIVNLPNFDSQLELVVYITPHSPENRNLVCKQTVASIILQDSPKAFINQIDIGSDQITVSWSDFSSNSNSVYLIKCNETISTWSNDSSMSATVSGLLPDSVYSLQLFKCSQDICGQLIGSSIVHTEESTLPPLEVKDLEVQTMNSTHVHLNWDAPLAESNSTNSSDFLYDVRLVQTMQTNNTDIYLLNRCQSVLWPDTYEIAVQTAGQYATWKSIEVKCQPDPVSDTYSKGQSFPATNLLVVVAVVGFLVGAAVYALTCRTFTYTYKVKGNQT